MAGVDSLVDHSDETVSLVNNAIDVDTAADTELG
jgi:hypothetical protein